MSMYFSSVYGRGRCLWGGPEAGLPADKPKWITRLKKPPGFNGGCAFTDDTMIVALENGDLRALDRETGKQRWRVDVRYALGAPDISVIDTVVVAGDSVIDVESGEQIGRFGDLDGVAEAPTVYGIQCANYYLLPIDIDKAPGEFVLFEAATRTFSRVELPFLTAVGTPTSDGVVGWALDGARTKLGYSDTKTIVGYDVPGRQIAWQQRVGPAFQLRLFDGASIYLEDAQYVRRIDRASGELLWETDFSSYYPGTDPATLRFHTAVYAPDVLYLMAVRKLIRTEAATGRVIDVRDDFEVLRGCAAGDLFFALGEYDGMVTAYDRYRLEPLWSTPKKSVYYSVRVAGNHVYAIDARGNVYAYEWDEIYVSDGQHLLAAKDDVEDGGKKRKENARSAA